MASTSTMFMYHLTLQPPTAVTQAIVGQFARTKEQQILMAAGSRITLYRPDSQVGKLFPILSHDVFGVVRKMATFRLAGSGKGSDSGRLVILEYQPQVNRFDQLRADTFGKSGIRRVVPGEFVASDAKGRCVMVASVEKNKLVYVMSREIRQDHVVASGSDLIVSSPLEAHTPATLVFALIGLDVGHDNPIFATLEVDYKESDLDSTGVAFHNIEKQLVYYELDLGLNHVVRKWSDTVDRTANILFQVPGGDDGPSGVLVCSEDNITYRHHNQDALRVAIPRRRALTEDPNRRRYITAGVMHKMKDQFFFLLQAEDGDVFRLTIDMKQTQEGKTSLDAERLNIKYFDTLPVATSLCVLKNGFLFAACENGDHHLYTFLSLGDDDEETVFESGDFPAEPTEPYNPPFYEPRAHMNVAVAESIKNMSPNMDSKVLNLLANADSPQIYSVCGSGARSSFRTLKYGLETSELAESGLPSTPSAVWATKIHKDDPHHSYIVLSFTNSSLVLTVGETVEEASDTGFLDKGTPTLAVQLIGDDLLVQVHPRGIRYILSNGAVRDWKAPQHRTVVAASTNEQQIAVALSSGEIIYFEADADGAVHESSDKFQSDGTVTCLSLGEVPPGRLRSGFLAIGSDDSTVRILSLDPEEPMITKSLQALSASPISLLMMPMEDSSGGTTLYLHIGLYNGLYLRTMVDETTGELEHTRVRFLGGRPVKLTRVTIKERSALLALSTRPWLAYSDEQTKMVTLNPMDFEFLEGACNFSSSQCPEGMVGISNQSLKIFSVENLSNNYIVESIPLPYTPRAFVQFPEQPIFFVIGSDNNTLAPATKTRLLNEAATNGTPNTVTQELPPEHFGHPRGVQHWASQIQVVDPLDAKSIIASVDLDSNEAAVSLALVPFASQDGETFLLVGTGKDMVATPRSYTCGFIHVYRTSENFRLLTFIHKTQLDHPPYSMVPFTDRLLTGVGRDLMIFDLGMKQLLRKTRMRCGQSNITGIQTQGHRIIISDDRESITYAAYKQGDNKIIPFADDTTARWTTASAMVDYDTVAGGDKFGNVWLLRCPREASDEADEEGTTALLTHRPYLRGTATRLELMIHFFVQDIPMAIHKTPLIPGGSEVLVWTGLQGTIGVLAPFVAREQVDWFRNLEDHMKQEEPPLSGRDHLIYRGYYAPVKNVIDGDLCERFLTLPHDKKATIAGHMDEEVVEMERKIQEARTRVAF
ncbi:MAG: pre-mRNA-splicing factor rse1 [Bogoriella megaspora]|nr:MAG: pre-mRNA-splicing factor rse1 [Bogoriella megaspora]